MQATEMRFGIWDELNNCWLVCEFGEDKHAIAEVFAAHMNAAHNKKRKETFQRYRVKAKGGE